MPSLRHVDQPNWYIAHTNLLGLTEHWNEQKHLMVYQFSRGKEEGEEEGEVRLVDGGGDKMY